MYENKHFISCRTRTFERAPLLDIFCSFERQYLLFGLHHRLQLFRKLDLKYVFVEAKRFVKGGQQYLFKYLTTLHFSYYGVKLS